jgi:hypothetical protein
MNGYGENVTSQNRNAAGILGSMKKQIGSYFTRRRRNGTLRNPRNNAGRKSSIVRRNGNNPTHNNGNRVNSAYHAGVLSERYTKLSSMLHDLNKDPNPGLNKPQIRKFLERTFASPKSYFPWIREENKPNYNDDLKELEEEERKALQRGGKRV